MDQLKRADLQNTILIYCRDLLEEIGEYPEFAAENGALEELLAGGLVESYDSLLSRRLGDILARYRRRVLALLTLNPESRYLDRLHKRVDSIAEMSQSITEGP